ncbi:hypothetical protein Cci01nite_71920 [Catellatospora citrea]|uniref:5'-3' exonuclease n=2 Tax=Catellatospora citrea TaxID=53366 RepID=A0A8J3KNZ0_9ACTN|nr:DNA polymerase-1 [Catellatospora citrea]GIG02099.1 hypothetical protein Cci01nite_71920 [Catellatospora citrea]
MGGTPHLQPMLPIPGTEPAAPDMVPLLLVDGHNLLWGGTFGFPAPIYSRDKTRLLTGLFAFFALLRVAIREDVPGGQPEVLVVFDGEHGGADRKETHEGYKASRPADDAALLPLQFLPDVKRGLNLVGISWAEMEHAEADDVIATIVSRTPPPRPILMMTRDKDYYQLIDDRVVVLNTKFRAGQRLVTPAEVFRRHAVTPAQWADFRALSGDPADEIPGVHGIGATTAAKLLAEGLSLDELPASGRLASGRGRHVAEQFELALKWRNMIRLQTDLDVPCTPTGEPSPLLPKPADLVEELGLW